MEEKAGGKGGADEMEVQSLHVYAIYNQTILLLWVIWCWEKRCRPGKHLIWHQAGILLVEGQSLTFRLDLYSLYLYHPPVSLQLEKRPDRGRFSLKNLSYSVPQENSLNSLNTVLLSLTVSSRERKRDVQWFVLRLEASRCVLWLLSVTLEVKFLSFIYRSHHGNKIVLLFKNCGSLNLQHKVIEKVHNVLNYLY